MSSLSERLKRYKDGAEDGDWGDVMLPGSELPTPVHRALVDLMDTMLSLAKAAAHEHGSAATALAVALRTMHKLRPMALESLATIPEDEVKVFMRHLSNQLESVVTAGEVHDGAGGPELEAPRAGLSRGGDANGEVDAD